MLQVAASILSVKPQRITINSTNTYRIANTSPSAASATADLNGKAVQLACIALMERLTTLAATLLNVSIDLVRIEHEQVFVSNKSTHLDWNALIVLAYANRINLSEHAHYATPEIHFDKSIEKGHPFAYHVFGTALITVTVDCIRGNYVIDEAKIVHDYGNSMNPHIDKGQIEGGLAQGIGWMTIEEIVYDEMGKLRSNALSTYKVPDIYSVPKTVEILPLETAKDNLAIFQSKAVGEPPLLYGIGAYFAIRNAVKAFNPSIKPPFQTPFTPEKVLLNLYAAAADALHFKYS
jgi:xanthine dehydrogenase large subunit